ncbi:MAG: hypothetical protein IPK05_10420, partial [Comamonadaceae bacterium]|nr:hypothetical protein [Comamonadaceae bacterium]
MEIQAAPPGWLPTLALFALIFLSFIPWMRTTGNGRYFMPYLILIGPLCIALINLIQSTANMKMFLTIAVLGLQGFALYQNTPWRPVDSWTWIEWKDAPYLPLEFGKQAIDPEAIVTITVPTYSLAAPLSPPLRAGSTSRHLARRTRTSSLPFMPRSKSASSGKPLNLFMVSAPRSMKDGPVQPDQNAINQITPYLEAHDLRLKSPTNCQLIKSKSMAPTGFIVTEESPAERTRVIEHSGFWICPIEYAVSPRQSNALTAEQLGAKALFEKMEQICPRFFNPGQQGVSYHRSGFQRRYSVSDSFLIATGDGPSLFQIRSNAEPPIDRDGRR